jgi:hypothetical protein
VVAVAVVTVTMVLLVQQMSERAFLQQMCGRIWSLGGIRSLDWNGHVNNTIDKFGLDNWHVAHNFEWYVNDFLDHSIDWNLFDHFLFDDSFDFDWHLF